MWIGKESRPKLEPRILLEVPEKSYHAKHRVTDHDLFDNRHIFGDNLLVFKRCFVMRFLDEIILCKLLLAKGLQ